MEFEAAQHNMREAYLDGSTGVLVSGVVWCCAAGAGMGLSQQAGMLVLFFGGMAIHPLSILIDRILGRTGRHDNSNPLGKLALEGTILLFAGLLIAFLVSEFNADWFFPVMLLVIGVRYLTFQTLYGLKFYWLLGGILSVLGSFALLSGLDGALAALLGGLVELGLGAYLLFSATRPVNG